MVAGTTLCETHQQKPIALSLMFSVSRSPNKCVNGLTSTLVLRNLKEILVFCDSDDTLTKSFYG